MAEARIDPTQLEQAVKESVARVLERPPVIRKPILIGIVAWPDDKGQVSFEEISGQYGTGS